ncbi:MAG: sulfotransferase, partial [Actinomycetota bacterium]|nr:sulfotransferase [Actinomycetota bacterium]
MTSEFAFVLGTGRCGSTLVHELVARHPDVGFLSNLEDRVPLPAAAGRWNNELYRRVPEPLTRKGRLRFAPSEGYRALERVGSPALTAPVRDLLAEDVTPWLDARLHRFFEDRAHAQHKPLFLHKFTGWPRSGLLGRVFPEAKFVHVLRDGRAVANSFLQMPWWRGYAGPSGWGWGPLPATYAAEWESSGRSFAVLAGIQWK